MLREEKNAEGVIMYIRKLNVDDIVNHHVEVKELLKICFQNTYEDEILDEVIESKYTGLIDYVRSGKAHTFGAIKEESLIGFLWGYPIDTPMETVFHVAYISVMEAGRRLGIGQSLLGQAEKECMMMELNHIELIVGAENISALNFYDYCGYRANRYYMRKEVR